MLNSRQSRTDFIRQQRWFGQMKTQNSAAPRKEDPVVIDDCRIISSSGKRDVLHMLMRISYKIKTAGDKKTAPHPDFVFRILIVACIMERCDIRASSTIEAVLSSRS